MPGREAALRPRREVQADCRARRRTPPIAGRAASRDRTDPRVSEVDELIAVEGSEETLLAAWATGEIVGEAESHEARLEIAEVEMGGSCQL